MSRIPNQIVELYREKGLFSVIKNAPNIKKSIDYKRSRLLIPIEHTIWGTYEVTVQGMLNSSISRSRLPRLGTEAIHGIYDGTWDKYTEEFEDMIIYQSIKNHFENNVSWEDTKQFQLAKKKIIKNNRTAWNGCNSIDQLYERCEYLDELYENINENGFLFNSELAYSVGKYDVSDVLIAGIDRNGNLIRLANCRHRAAMASILNIKIPAVITVCHNNHVQTMKGFRPPK